MKLSTTQLLLTLLAQATAHILLKYPPPRENRGDLASFDTSGPNVCNGNDGCDSFCGASTNTNDVPTTELPVETDIEFKWLVNVPHTNDDGVLKYRLALNGQGDGDAHFDDPANLLGYGSDENYNETSGVVKLTVKIPASFLQNCSDPSKPCALQVFDDVYYVSCANVVLVAADDTKNHGLNDTDHSSGGADSGSDGESGSNSTIGQGGQGSNGNSGSTNNTGNGQTGQGSGGGDDQASTQPMVDHSPNGTIANGTFVKHSVKLANRTGSDNLGFCPAISGSSFHGNVTCFTVMGGSCQPYGSETSFGYRDSKTSPAIYATHVGGYKAGSGNASECTELPTVYNTSGCLTAYGIQETPNRFGIQNIQEGARLALFECNDRAATQKFYYTHTGKFQIINRRTNNTFCLGMGEKITTTPDGLMERELLLMSCNETLTDPNLINWAINPRPVNLADELPGGVALDEVYGSGTVVGSETTGEPGVSVEASKNGGRRFLRA